MFPGGDPEANEVDYLRTMDFFLRGDITQDDDGEAADYLFTREISQIRTAADATAFVNKLWVTLSTNEQRHVLDVYHGRCTAVSSMRIIQDKVNAVRDYLAGLERAREAEADAHRGMLAADPERAPHPADARSARSARFTPLADLYDDYLDGLSCLVEALESESADAGVVYGGGPDASVRPGIDMRVYKILALCDSFHDFGRTHATEFRAAVGVDELPEGLTVDVLANEKSVVDYFDGRADLDFGGGAVRHVLHGRKLLHRHSVADSMNTNHGEYWLAYRQQHRRRDVTPSLRSVDLWCLPQFDEAKEKMMPFHKVPPKGHKSVVYLSQIAGVVASIKERFGDGNLTFVMDKSDDQLSRLMMATSKLDAAIGRMHIVKQGDLGFATDETRLATGDEPAPREKWTYAVCDASMLDGNTHVRSGDLPHPNPTVLRDATGGVYPEGFPASVHFDGVGGEGDGLSVRVTADGASKVYGELVKRRVEAEFSSSDPRDDPDLVNPKWAPFSTSRMRDRVEDRLESGAGGIGTPLALKRACDWGQVEHCVRHGTPDNRYVFVSKDRIACLYAMYRNADFVYMAQPKKVQNSSWDTPVILQVTLNMCRSLTRDETLAAAGDGRQRGGGIGALHVALSAVVVAAAFVGSIFRR